jgi:Protein of unknown function (DUF2505)
MPRSFDVSFDSPASVEQVHSAFGDEKYWLARLVAFGGGKALESLVVGSDGTVSVVVTEDLRHGGLPAILTTFYRRDLNILTKQTWTPIGDGHVSGEISVAVTGAPGWGHGAAMLAPLGNGSRLKLSGTVQFNVPLVGGKVESFIAREFAQGIPEIQRFTTTWIGEHV